MPLDPRSFLLCQSSRGRLSVARARRGLVVFQWAMMMAQSRGSSGCTRQREGARSGAQANDCRGRPTARAISRKHQVAHLEHCDMIVSTPPASGFALRSACAAASSPLVGRASGVHCARRQLTGGRRHLPVQNRRERAARAAGKSRWSCVGGEGAEAEKEGRQVVAARRGGVLAQPRSARRALGEALRARRARRRGSGPRRTRSPPPAARRSGPSRPSRRAVTAAAGGEGDRAGRLAPPP